MFNVSTINHNNQKTLNHIQFLRGISVLLVFFYHLKLEYFNYGFLGVDIFFVISGFVISSMIYHEIETTKKFNFYNFYVKRFKRIYPVLLFILSISFILVIFFQPLELFLNNFNVYIKSLFGISNFYYLSLTKDYFDTVFDDPFAHTWSLGIELQFYIFFPLVLFCLLKYISFFRNIFILVLLIIIGICFSNFFQESIKLIFYSPLFRFWEFLIGTLTFFLTNKLKFKNNYLSLLVFFVLLFFILIPKNISLPNIILVTCIFTSIFILSYRNNKNEIFNYLVENKFLIFLGNASYSFYLWHLPIIYFYDLYFLDSLLRVPLLFSIILLLSYLSFKFVENRYRYLKVNISFNLRNTIYSTILLSTILVISNLTLKDSRNNSIKYKFKNLIYSLNYLENKINYTNRVAYSKINIDGNGVYRFCTKDSWEKKIVLNSNNLKIKCLKKGKKNQRIFFIEGNSLTAHFIPMFNEISIDDSIYYSHIGGPLLNTSIDLINSLHQNYNEVVYVTHILDDKYFNRFLEIQNKFNKDTKFLILGSTPHARFNMDPLECFIKNVNCEYDTFKDIKKRNLKSLNIRIDKIAKNNLNLDHFDPYKSICPNRICKVFDKEKDLITHKDHVHLTIEGAFLMIEDFMSFYNKTYKN
jgi:peptidoglycan/LPS O-acetylase OafA/YrhL